MNTPGSDSNESPAKRKRMSSAATPALQLPNDKSQDHLSSKRISEFDVNKNSNKSLHRNRMPQSIEEEKHVNHVDAD